jgi:hypothetical protein
LEIIDIFTDIGCESAWPLPEQSNGRDPFGSHFAHADEQLSNAGGQLFRYFDKEVLTHQLLFASIAA